MTEDKYAKILRLVGASAAICLWSLSVYFSSKGFGFEMGNELTWVGTVLAVIITALQVIWNHEAKNANLTIFIVGMLSYFYGIWANIQGIASLQPGTMSLLDNPKTVIFPVLLGLFVEIVPEPLIVWAIIGKWSSGDFFGNLFSADENVKRTASQLRKPKRKPSNGGPRKATPSDLAQLEKLLQQGNYRPIQKPSRRRN